MLIRLPVAESVCMLLLLFSGCAKVGPFVIELEAEEEIDTPIVVTLMQSRGAGGERHKIIYQEQRIVRLNEPVEFPASSEIVYEDSLGIRVLHPHYVMEGGNGLSLLPPGAKPRHGGGTTTLYDSLADATRLPDKYSFVVKLKRIDKALNELEENKRNWGHTNIAKGLRNALASMVSRAEEYRQEVQSSFPDIDYRQFESLYIQTLDEIGVPQEDRPKWLRTIRISLGLEE